AVRMSRTGLMGATIFWTWLTIGFRKSERNLPRSNRMLLKATFGRLPERPVAVLNDQSRWKSARSDGNITLPPKLAMRSRLTAAAAVRLAPMTLPPDAISENVSRLLAAAPGPGALMSTVNAATE